MAYISLGEMRIAVSAIAREIENSGESVGELRRALERAGATELVDPLLALEREISQAAARLRRM